MVSSLSLFILFTSFSCVRFSSLYFILFFFCLQMNNLSSSFFFSVWNSFCWFYFVCCFPHSLAGFVEKKNANERDENLNELKCSTRCTSIRFPFTWFVSILFCFVLSIVSQILAISIQMIMWNSNKERYANSSTSVTVFCSLHIHNVPYTLFIFIPFQFFLFYSVSLDFSFFNLFRMHSVHIVSFHFIFFYRLTKVCAILFKQNEGKE